MWKDKFDEPVTEEDEIVIKWQTNRFGTFYNALCSAIAHADQNNREKLARSFPLEVRAITRYQNEEGYGQTFRDRGLL
jgi:hypothetical protein